MGVNAPTLGSGRAPTLGRFRAQIGGVNPPAGERPHPNFRENRGTTVPDFGHLVRGGHSVCRPFLQLYLRFLFTLRLGFIWNSSSYGGGGRLLDMGAHNPGAASGRPIQCPS